MIPVWKIEMITAISSLIAMNSFCSVERLLWACVCFVTWLIQKQQSVQSSVTPQGLLWGWCTNTLTHLGPLSTAGCAVSYLAQRLCAAAFAKSPPHYVQQHTHTHVQRLNQHTPTNLATIYRAAHHPSNEWDARGTLVFRGSGELAS